MDLMTEPKVWTLSNIGMTPHELGSLLIGLVQIIAIIYGIWAITRNGTERAREHDRRHREAMASATLRHEEAMDQTRRNHEQAMRRLEIQSEALHATLERVGPTRATTSTDA